MRFLGRLLAWAVAIDTLPSDIVQGEAAGDGTHHTSWRIHPLKKMEMAFLLDI